MILVNSICCWKIEEGNVNLIAEAQSEALANLLDTMETDQWDLLLCLLEEPDFCEMLVDKDWVHLEEGTLVSSVYTLYIQT